MCGLVKYKHIILHVNTIMINVNWKQLSSKKVEINNNNINDVSCVRFLV